MGLDSTDTSRLDITDENKQEVFSAAFALFERMLTTIILNCENGQVPYFPELADCDLESKLIGRDTEAFRRLFVDWNCRIKTMPVFNSLQEQRRINKFPLENLDISMEVEKRMNLCHYLLAKMFLKEFAYMVFPLRGGDGNLGEFMGYAENILKEKYLPENIADLENLLSGGRRGEITVKRFTSPRDLIVAILNKDMDRLKAVKENQEEVPLAAALLEILENSFWIRSREGRMVNGIDNIIRLLESSLGEDGSILPVLNKILNEKLDRGEKEVDLRLEIRSLTEGSVGGKIGEAVKKAVADSNGNLAQVLAIEIPAAFENAGYVKRPSALSRLVKKLIVLGAVGSASVGGWYGHKISNGSSDRKTPFPTDVAGIDHLYSSVGWAKFDQAPFGSNGPSQRLLDLAGIGEGAIIVDCSIVNGVTPWYISSNLNDRKVVTTKVGAKGSLLYKKGQVEELGVRFLPTVMPDPWNRCSDGDAEKKSFYVAPLVAVDPSSFRQIETEVASTPEQDKK